MNKHITSLASFALVFLGLSACTSKPVVPVEKQLYLPEEFAGQDWQSDENAWSFGRMKCTDNMAIFWEKGFGESLAQPPALEGQAMQVDLPNLEQKLETFYHYFKDTLQFVKSGSLSETYRMMVMVNYSLEGTAYGGTYDDTIGALWITPNRLQDPKLNTVAHELGHSFQAQIQADKAGECWNGHPIFEMCSQWMLWQVNPEWVADENYHWQAFKDNTHKAFLHLENMYRSPYVLEYWSQQQGKPYIAELFRQGKGGEDPVMTHKRLQKLDQEALNDELFDSYRQLVNFDYPRVYDVMRPWANTFQPMANAFSDAGQGWKQIKPECCPENYGFNVIALALPESDESVSVSFRGMPFAIGYHAQPELSGWRYGFVAVDTDDVASYSPVGHDINGTVDFKPVASKPLKHLWLVVMGAPSEHTQNPHESPDLQWPYQISLTSTEIL